MHRCLTEHRILPVGAGTQQGGIGKLGTIVREGHLVAVVGELPQVHHLQAGSLALYAVHPFIGELGFSCFPSLGSDEHHTVGTLCTVDGGGGGILQDFHREDVGGIDGGKRGDGGYGAVTQRITQAKVGTTAAAALYDHPVNHIERFRIGIDGGLSAHANRNGGPGSTGGHHGCHTRCPALKCLVEVGDHRSLDGILTHGDGGTGDVTLPHGTVAHYHHLVEQFGIFVHLEVEGVAVSHHHLQCLISDAGDHQYRAGGVQIK